MPRPKPPHYAEKHDAWPAWRNRLHEIIFEADDPAGKAFDIVLLIAILLSVAAVTLDSVAWINERYHLYFIVVEWVFTILFTIEYVLRLICVRRPVRYARSFFGIVDLLSILPTYLSLLIPGANELMVIRTFRLLRIFRIFKLMRFLGEADALKQALLTSRHKIIVFLATMLIIVTIMGALMHLVEGTYYGNEQFSSLPQSMYWAIVTMTTVGYGDITPVTTAGKLISAAMMIIGYSLIIVPTGIITAEMTWGRKPRDQATTQHCPHCSRHGHDIDATFCKHCGGRLNPVSVD